jgi:hypothetical protein
MEPYFREYVTILYIFIITNIRHQGNETSVTRKPNNLELQYVFPIAIAQTLLKESCVGDISVGTSKHLAVAFVEDSNSILKDARF